MYQNTDRTKLWRTIKGIDGREKRTTENEAITFNGISFSSSEQLAAKFNQQFNTSKLDRHAYLGETRLVTRETKKKPMEMTQTFIADLVMRAIKSCRNSKTFVPNKLIIFHLTTLGPRVYQRPLQPFCHDLSDSSYMEVIINHPYTEAWQRHLSRIFISAHLASLHSRESPGNSDPTNMV